MSFLSILEGELNVVHNHTQRPCRLSPIELEAARRFILMTKLDVPTFNFYSAGSVLSWCGGEKHPASEAMADLQMILDRILVPLGYSLTGDMFAYDNNSFSIARIFVENDVVRLCLCQCVCLLFLLSTCCPFLKSFRCFTSMSHTQVCIANMHDILAERERTTSISLMINLPRYLGASNGTLARVSVSSNGLFRDVVKSFWKVDGIEPAVDQKGVHFHIESVRLASDGFKVTFEAFTQSPDVDHVLMLYVPPDPLNMRSFADNNNEISVQIAKHVKSLMQNVNSAVGYAGLYIIRDRSYILQTDPFDMNDFTEVSIESAGPAFLRALLRA